jgi:hypothetical protein
VAFRANDFAVDEDKRPMRYLVGTEKLTRRGVEYGLVLECEW